MSKSAIKTINAALVIINKAGVSLPHLLNIQDPALRVAWRNADHLACFTVRCLADCFEAESLETIAQHEWDSMNTACQRYFESGLDLWNGKQWKETGHINAAEELERLAAMVARWVAYHDKLAADQANAAMQQARAASSYEEIKRARHIAANSFGGTIGEQEDLVELLDRKGHYAAALLVKRFDGSRFPNQKAERQAFKDFLTKCLCELVDLDHAVALNMDSARTATAEANDEARRAIDAGDLDLRGMCRHNAPDLVMIAVGNLQRCYAEDVNPLGYLITKDGHICKIESVEDCIDGDGFINVFYNGHTEAIYYSRKALVNWFMPLPAPEVTDEDFHLNNAIKMAACARSCRINPLNFAAMIEYTECETLPRYAARVWTDYGDKALAAMQYAPRKYESRQAALDSGDYDKYKSLAGAVLKADIDKGLIVIEQ